MWTWPLLTPESESPPPYQQHIMQSRHHICPTVCLATWDFNGDELPITRKESWLALIALLESVSAYLEPSNAGAGGPCNAHQ